MSDKKTLAIIGGGNIGSRHLQAMSKLPFETTVYVVDPSEDSLEKARALYAAMPNSAMHEVHYETSIASLPERIDLAIIATSSRERRSVIESLLEHATVPYMILEKVLFQKIEDYHVVKELFLRKGTSAWVNCSRRHWPAYRELKSRFSDAGRLEVQVTGSHWGLGCNAVHMADLVAFLSGSSDISIHSSSFDQKLIPSKRKGYYELEGTVSGSMGACDSFAITAYATESDIPLKIVVLSDVLECVIDEPHCKIWAASPENNWVMCESPFEVKLMSEISHELVQDILETGTSRLASFDESMRLHVALMGPFMQHFESMGIEEGVCPTT